MEQEIDINDLIHALWRKKIIILLVTIIFFCIGFLLYGRNTTNSSKNKSEEINYSETNFMFSIDNKTLITTSNAETSEKLIVDNKFLASLEKIATSRDFLSEAVKDIGVSSKDVDISKLQENIKVLSGSDIITLVVSSTNKDIALKLPEKILNEIENKSKILYDINNLIIVDETELVSKEKIDKIVDEINALKENSEVSFSQPQEGPSMKKVILITLVRIYWCLWSYNYNRII